MVESENQPIKTCRVRQRWGTDHFDLEFGSRRDDALYSYLTDHRGELIYSFLQVRGQPTVWFTKEQSQERFDDEVAFWVAWEKESTAP